jgi:hypothetical protein
MDLAALIISVLALAIAVLALPSAFQMWWGAPAIELTQDTAQNSEGKSLNCHIHNRTIGSKFLRRMRVSRQPSGVMVDFSIFRVGDNKMVANTIRPILSTEKEEGRQVIVSSFLPAIFAVVVFNNSKAKVFEEGLDDESDEILLARGRYKLTINVNYAHDRWKTYETEFTVGLTGGDFYWSDDLKLLKSV